MGDDPPHRTVPGGFPEQGGLSAHRKTPAAALVRKFGVPPLGGGDGGENVGGGFRGGGGVGLEEEEYACAVLLILDLCE